MNFEGKLHLLFGNILLCDLDTYFLCIIKYYQTNINN